MKPRIVITVGDPAGIGPEIVAAAVRDPELLARCEPIVVGDPVAFALHKRPLPKVEMVQAPGLRKDLPLGRPSLEAGRSALEALQVAVGLIQARQAQALVTAPVSKESLHLARAGVPGHTEWLARECRARAAAMLMVAGRMRALLMTRHVPLRRVAKELKPETVIQCARLGYEFCRKYLTPRPHPLPSARGEGVRVRGAPRLVICGLNPHAGDHGLIGNEEQTVFKPALRALRRRGILIHGPFPADTVFRDMARGRYDLALAAYHDQGMIPLKLYAADKLVNITLGLPFVRTSPGHGTAYDIAGKGAADARPMKEAIRLAAEYSCAPR